MFPRSSSTSSASNALRIIGCGIVMKRRRKGNIDEWKVFMHPLSWFSKWTLDNMVCFKWYITHWSIWAIWSATDGGISCWRGGGRWTGWSSVAMTDIVFHFSSKHWKQAAQHAHREKLRIARCCVTWEIPNIPSTTISCLCRKSILVAVQYTLSDNY